MYFEVVNSPENFRRRKEGAGSQHEVTPRLILAPFSAAPKVIFDNVPIGRTANQLLDICNPGNKQLFITLIKEPSFELGLNVPLREFHIQAGETVQLSLSWCPNTTISVRETVYFQDDCRGKYEVILIFKSVAIRKPAKVGVKCTPTKVSSKKIVKRRSPAKTISPPSRITSKVIQNKFDQSRVSINNSNCNVDFRLPNREIKLTNSVSSRHGDVNYHSNLSLEEGDLTCGLTGRATFLVQNQNKYRIVSTPPKTILNAIENLEFTPLRCKADKKRKGNYPELGQQSASTKTSNAYEYLGYPNENINYADYETFETYHSEYRDPKNNKVLQLGKRKNPFLKKTANAEHPMGTINSNNFFDDGLEKVGSHEVQHANNTHPIIDLENIDSSVPFIYNSPHCKSHASKRVIDLTTPDKCDSFNVDVTVSPRHGCPVTISSPSENFRKRVEADPYQDKNSLQSISIVINNMGFSQLNDSEIVFDPHRCSTERKEPHKSCPNGTTPTICKGLFEDDSISKINSAKSLGKPSIERADSPIIPLDPNNPYNLQSSPYGNENNLNKISIDEINAQKHPHSILNLIDGANANFDYKQNGRKRCIINRNCADNVKNVIEANLWQKSPTSTSTLPLIPEESCILSETQCLDNKMETFTFNRTYDLPPSNGTFNVSSRSQNNCVSYNHKSQIWSKSANKLDGVVWKLPVLPKIDDKLKEINLDHLIMNAYSTATTIDPFLSTSYFYDEELVDKFAKVFKRWLNFLLTPPAELDAAADGPRVDVGKIWIESRNKEVPEAPTREQVSSKYHTSHRLDSLRKSARNLLMSEHTMSVFVKLSAQIDKKILSIRPDKNLHLDIGLQKIIMDLLLCYNPLWLRMGLEAIYGTVIPLTSNNDILGLSTFIIQRMFKDPYMKSKHAQPTLPNMITPQYTEYMKKFTLKKFFMLVYFLDQAKQKKMICHDPCLFCRTAPYKESREMLIRFTRELITGVGDITKHLRPLGYVVTHKQSDLDEFRYAVHNLAVDLKDGVRLTRLMEIILVREGLTNRLRVPAISRLQKIHNVKIALTALNEAGFDITGEITAKDISDGHREKTLSLLWQIIHRFRAPLFEKAASTIQVWWRKKYLMVWIRNRIQRRKLEKLSNAAVKIQAYWKKFVCHKKYIQLKKATLTIQQFYKRSFIRTQFIKKKTACIRIQQWYRATRLMEAERCHFLKLKKSCIYIQRKYRSLKCGILCRKKYTQLKKSALMIQAFYRNILLMRFHRDQYIRKKVACIHIQQWYRASKLMKSQRNYFEKLKTSSINVQRTFRSLRSGRLCREKYMQLKKATLTIQLFYRNILLMRLDRDQFLRVRAACIRIQQWYRTTAVTNAVRNDFIKLKTSCINIQRRYRALKLAIVCRKKYTQLKKVTLMVQQFHRSKVLMRSDRAQFLRIKAACVRIQQRYRATRLMKAQKNYFEKLKTSTINVQRRYRSLRIGTACRKQYLQLKKATSTIQQCYRSKVLMRSDRDQFIRKKSAVIYIQQWFRATRLMKAERLNFKKLKIACINTQCRYKSLKIMQKIRTDYFRMKYSAVKIQRWFRATLLMVAQKNSFNKLKIATAFVQRKYRAKRLMLTTRSEYMKKKRTAIVIQRWFRSMLEMFRCREKYSIARKSAILIQTWYLSILKMRKDRRNYCDLRFNIIKMQRLYRGKVLTKQHRENYLNAKSCVITIQSIARCYITRRNYLRLRQAAIAVQAIYRRKKAIEIARLNRKRIISTIIIIQAYIRGQLARRRFREKMNAVLKIQRFWKGVLAMRRERKYFLDLRQKIVLIQNVARGYSARSRLAKLKEEERQRQEEISNKAAHSIQNFYRGYRLMMTARSRYLEKKQAAVAIQLWLRSIREMSRCRDKYAHMKNSAISIQKWYLSILHMRKEKSYYCRLRVNVIKMQRLYRCKVFTKLHRETYLYIRSSVIRIQAVMRCFIIRKKYLRLRHAAITVQAIYKQKKAVERARLNRKQIVFKIIMIQTYIRGQLARRRFREKLNAVLKIQRFWKGVLATRSERKSFLDLLQKIILIQSLARGYLVRSHLEKLKELMARKKQEEVVNKAALQIQKIWRGYKVRQEYLDDRVINLRKRWQRGALESQQETLAERNEDALEVLQHFSDMASVIRAFLSLDLLTRVYPMMYDRDNMGSSVCEKLILYMSATNRSISSLETLRLSVSILLNLTKYKPLFVYSKCHVNIILTLMMRWCDKDSQFFRFLCTLIWLFANYDHLHKELCVDLAKGDNNKMLKRIRSLIQRKSRMEERTRSRNNSFNLNNSIFSVSLNSSRLNNTMTNNTNILPSFKPDYGIQQPNRPRVFQSDIQAIDNLFLKFNLRF